MAYFGRNIDLFERKLDTLGQKLNIIGRKLKINFEHYVFIYQVFDINVLDAHYILLLLCTIKMKTCYVFIIKS